MSHCRVFAFFVNAMSPKLIIPYKYRDGTMDIATINNIRANRDNIRNKIKDI